MGELIKYEGVSSLEKKLIESTYALKVHEATEAQVKDAVISGVTNALFNLGQKIEDDNERMILQSKIYVDLRLHFQSLTIEEIKNAFDLGSKGEFRNKPDEVLYLSPEKIYNWLKSYKFGMKAEAVKTRNELQAKEEKKEALTQEEKDAIVLKYLKIDACYEFDLFKKTGMIYDPVNVVYNNLDRLGIIPFTNQRKTEIYEKAVQFLKNTRCNDRDFMKGLNAMTAEVQGKIKIEARKIALKIFFQEITEMGIELSDLIDEKLAEGKV